MRSADRSGRGRSSVTDMIVRLNGRTFYRKELERPELNALRLLLRNVHPARRSIAVRPVVADAGDEQRVIGTELAQGHAERLDVGAIVGLNDERRLERKVDDHAEAVDGVVQFAVIRAGCEAVADEEKVARAGELRAADEDARFVA